MPVCEECGCEYDTTRVLRIHQTKEHNSEHPWREPSVLEELYHDGGLNTVEIGERLGCNAETVRSWMERHEIPREREEPAYHDEEVLRDLYCGRRLSASEIADRLGCTYESIYRWLEIRGIDRRTAAEGNSIVQRRKPAYFGTTPDGYELWSNTYGGESASVRVHRLVAVAEHGFDAVAGNIVHHENEVPWDNRPSNLRIMSLSEHTRHHAPHEADEGACR